MGLLSILFICFQLTRNEGKVKATANPNPRGNQIDFMIYSLPPPNHEAPTHALLPARTASNRPSSSS